jgi:hypothetical protein
VAAGGADLSDEQTTAVGPATIYAFLLVGGLYNLVLTGEPRARLSGLALYLFVTAAYWGAGVARAEICLDAEAVRAPRLRSADAATLLLVYALVSRGLSMVSASAHVGVDGIRLGWALLAGLVALGLLRRAPPMPVRRGLAVSIIAGALLGAILGAFHRGAVPVFSGPAISFWIGTALFIVAEEVIFRGALQRSLEVDLAWPTSSFSKVRLAAAVLTAALGIVAVAMTTASPTDFQGGRRAISLAISLQLAAALARAVTGRVSASAVARLVALAVCTFL